MRLAQAGTIDPALYKLKIEITDDFLASASLEVPRCQAVKPFVIALLRHVE